MADDNEEGVKMKKKLKLIALIATFCIMFTSVPILGGELNASAASNQIKVTATCNGWQNTVALRWNKIANPEWGYAIVVNGKVYAHVTKTTTYYAVKKLRSGTKYSFRVRTWKKVRSKMYYNSSTKKWQWTDPGKKYCTKTNYGMRYVYGTCSNLVYATTAPAKYTIRYDANGGKGAPANGTKTQNKAYTVSKQIPTCDGFKFTGWLIVETNKIVSPGSTIAAGSNANYTLKAQWEAVPEYSTIIFRNYDGSTLQKSKIKSGTMPVFRGSTPTKPSDASYDYTFKDWDHPIIKAEGDAIYIATYSQEPRSGDPGVGTTDPSLPSNPKKKTITDYRGNTRTVEWDDDYGCYVDWDENILCDPMQKYDKTFDGEFKDSYGTWIQKGGVTFKKDDLVNQTKPTASTTPGFEQFKVEMFNGDPDKLEFSIVNPVRTISTYDVDKNPITKMYIVGSKRFLLTQVFDPRVYSGTAGSKIKELRIVRLDDNITRCGFTSENICINIIYDGRQMGRITYNPNPNGTPMHPRRQAYFDIAQAAVDANGGPKSLEEDLEAIEEYVPANYTYDEINCLGGYQILESWSIYQYDVYGFQGHGTALPNQDNYSSHVAFHLDSNPNRFFETQGHY